MRFNSDEEKLQQLAANIRLLLLDVDGVLTDGNLYFSADGTEIKAFNTLDGHGIRMLLENEIEVGIITGRSSTIVENRAAELGIKILFQNQSNKLDALKSIIESRNYPPAEIAYVGDDLPDLSVMQKVGLSITVSNAHDVLLQNVSLITEKSGGKGAVREIADFLLQAQNKYAQYLS